MEKEENSVLQNLLELTGLPEEWLRAELEQLLVSLGQNADQINQMSLEQLRSALIVYLDSIDSALAPEFSSQQPT